MAHSDTTTQAARDVLAAKIARDIFRTGDKSAPFVGRAHRIQFMGGQYPDNEIPMGGFCEAALAAHIARTLDRLDRATEGPKP